MEPKGSLLYSQVPATRPYLEPTPSSPHDPLQLPGCSWLLKQNGSNLTKLVFVQYLSGS
jgi:hypothetical protein